MMNQRNNNGLYARYKKMFDPLYEISICKKDEIEKVTEFIDLYWKKGHALVKSRELMDWQYYNPNDDIYNFILARSRKTGEIHAIEGFIPTTQFDEYISSPMTWGAIWKARGDVAPAGLGVVVKQYRECEFATPYCCEVGISTDAVKYNKQLRNSVYALEPWYMPNLHLDKYKLIEFDKNLISKNGIFENYVSVVMDKIDLNNWEKVGNRMVYIPPFKSIKYYEQRYFNHPVYDYYAVMLTDTIMNEREVLFYRVVSSNGSRCIFVVDYIGDGTVIRDSRCRLEELMRLHKAEYILFLSNGINTEALQSAGFINRWNTQDIVPVYFEPFMKQNVDILCASRSEEITWTTFKGDADQDRPNIIY